MKNFVEQQYAIQQQQQQLLQQQYQSQMTMQGHRTMPRHPNG